MNYKHELQKNREYWEAILGKEICEKIIKEDVDEGERYSDTSDGDLFVLEVLCEELFDEEKGWEAYPSEGIFGNFYRFFGRLAVKYAGKSEMIGEEDLKNTILSNFYSSASWIPIRVLIQDIYLQREKGALRGVIPSEEYRNYQEWFLNDRNYIQKLCKRYPEMKRLLLLRIMTVIQQVRRIMSGLSEDAEDLRKQLFPENPFRKIVKIESGLSDTHHGGRTVAKIFLDNQKILIYKPRNLEKDQCFLELYGQFCHRAGLTFQSVRILAGKDYSWESYVEQRPCESAEEVKRYFQRMGILLFLCWLMDMSDMHGENIIAAGEYPIPVDLETLPGNHGDEIAVHENADRMVAEELKHSVLSVGILPVIT